MRRSESRKNSTEKNNMHNIRRKTKKSTPTLGRQLCLESSPGKQNSTLLEQHNKYSFLSAQTQQHGILTQRPHRKAAQIEEAIPATTRNTNRTQEGEKVRYIIRSNMNLVVSQAAGQGVTITGEKYYENWDWCNSVIFAATIITTIGYGNVAPKTAGGRVFCILYGLCGIPLCLTWISELGSFFGNRAKRLSQVLIRKGQSVKMVQITCTMVFLLWGLLFHLVLPPLVFMNYEGWTYLEGLYFSFITLTTVGFGDYVAGVNPSIKYPTLYRPGVELWMYMGLAWLSLFFSWNVHMVVEAHKVLKKRRQRHRLPADQRCLPEKEKQVAPLQRPMAIDIFNFLSEREAEDYSTVIKKIGVVARRKVIPEEVVGRSKSCSDLLEICTLEHSPRQRRRFSIGEPVFLRPPESLRNSFMTKQEEEEPLLSQEDRRGLAPEEKLLEKVTAVEEGDFVEDPNETSCPANSRHTSSTSTEESVQHPNGCATRFTISKVVMGDRREENDEKG